MNQQPTSVQRRQGVLDFGQKIKSEGNEARSTESEAKIDILNNFLHT